MQKTSVRFPESLLASLDRVAAERRTSRNQVIVESCRRAAEERTRWPAGFFSNDHLNAEDLRVLREGCEDFEGAIRAARRSRTSGTSLESKTWTSPTGRPTTRTDSG